MTNSESSAILLLKSHNGSNHDMSCCNQQLVRPIISTADELLIVGASAISAEGATHLLSKTLQLKYGEINYG